MRRTHVSGEARSTRACLTRSILILTAVGAALIAAGPAGAAGTQRPASSQGASAPLPAPGSPRAAAGRSPAPVPIPAGEERVFAFDLVGCSPGGACAGGSAGWRRIVVDRNAKRSELRVAGSPDGWSVLEGDATTSRQAVLGASQAAIYDVYVRLLGRDGSRCGCTDTRTDPLSGETLCRLGSIDLTRGSAGSRLTLAPARLFDPKLRDETWTVDPGTGTHLAQIRVYSPPQPISL